MNLTTDSIRITRERFRNMCLICFGEDNIQNIILSRYKTRSLLKLFQKSCTLEADLDLPENICIECIKNLLQVHQFQVQCRRSIKSLKNIYLLLFGEHTQPVVEIKKCDLIPENQDLFFSSHIFHEPNGEEKRYTVVDITENDKNEENLELHSNKFKAEEPTKIGQTLEYSNVDTDIFDHVRDHATDKSASSVIKRDNTGLTKRKRRISVATTDILKNKVKLKVKQWDCTNCSLLFKTYVKYRLHYQTEHSNNSDTKVLINSSKIKQKKRSETSLSLEIRKLVCVICGKLLEQRNMRLHLRIHATPKPFQCEYCPFRCNQSCNLRRHVRQHTGEKPYLCSICGYVTTQKTTLTLTHMKLHTKLDNPISCEHCPMKFNTKFDYNLHRKLHLMNEKDAKSLRYFNNKRNIGPLSFECVICGKRMRSKCGFTSHMRAHGNNARYRCEVCGKIFQLKSGLTLHSRTHTGEKPFECSLCPKRFSQAAHYKTHMLIHENKREHKCGYCGQTFNVKFTLMEHLRIHTGETIDCEFCGKQFRHNSNKRKHIRENHEI